MNTRRRLIAVLGAGALAPLASFAQQQTTKVFRIGFLGSTSASASGLASWAEAFRAGLHDLGYVVGKNLVIEYRWAEGKYARLPDLAGDLAGLKVDVLVAHSTPGARAAKQATTTIPIVMLGVGDAVASGLVSSLARPGGNITGLTILSPELYGKRLELLKDALPRIRRIAFLMNPDNPAYRRETHHVMQITARSLKVELQLFEARGPSDFEGAFTAMAKKRIGAVVVAEDSIFVPNAKGISALAAQQRLPSSGGREYAEAGGLIGYGVNRLEIYRRAADFVDKILKGAKPGDLPVEQAARFELVVNMKTAKALGLTIPNIVLQRADEVIE